MASPPLLRRLLFSLKRLQRQHLTKIRRDRDGLLSRLSHMNMFSLRAEPLRRGLAVGMFWTFIPMPFQMLPATFFAMLAGANLPIVLLCVWISNPLTYAPILYLENRIGRLLHVSIDRLFGFDLDVMMSGNIGGQLIYTLEGGIILGVVSATVGYGVGPFLSRQIQRISRKRQTEKTEERE